MFFTSLTNDVRSGLNAFSVFRRDGSEIATRTFALDGGPLFLRAGGTSRFDGAFAYATDVTVTPLPPAVALLAAPLLGLGWLSRRRRRQAGV